MDKFAPFDAPLKVIDTFFPKQAAYPDRLTTCKRCGATSVAWVQNASAKWYLANAGMVTRENGERVLVANKAYPHDCRQVESERARVATEQAAQLATTAQVEQERLEMVREMDAQGIEFDHSASKERLAVITINWLKANSWK